jgi:hypothetical protein
VCTTSPGARCLIPVHGHALRVAASFSVLLRRADGAAGVVDGAALLEGEELLGAETLVMDLGGGLNQILEVGAGQEVAEIDEFAVVLIFHCVELEMSFLEERY